MRAGLDAPIVLIDKRTAFERDRTWCFWDAGDIPGRELATARWTSWAVAAPRGSAVQSSLRHPYLHLPADRFYAAVLEELAASPLVELRLGERVLGVADRGEEVEVRTSAGSLRGAVAFDGLGAASPLAPRQADGAVELRQQFLGREVHAGRAVFDPGRAMLMDFRVEQTAGGLRFMYVLPYSPTRALVEDTTVGRLTVPAAGRRAAIDEYLHRVHGLREFEVVREERGSIPMTTKSFPLSYGPRMHAIGLAAGAARPSSGYAFVRIQRHVRALAGALAAGRPAPQRMASRRYDALDAVFLHALARDPGGFPECFVRLARTDARAFARFMADASTPADEARIIAALPKARFAREAFALTAARLPVLRREPSRDGARRRVRRDPAPSRARAMIARP